MLTFHRSSKETPFIRKNNFLEKEGLGNELCFILYEDTMINSYKDAGMWVVHSILIFHDSCLCQGYTTVLYCTLGVLRGFPSVYTAEGKVDCQVLCPYWTPKIYKLLFPG